MNIRVPGQKTKVACEKCQSLRSATWNYGLFTLQDGQAIEDVMTAYCDICSEPCGIATQSGWKIREAQEAKKCKRTTIRVSLPLIDLAANRAVEAGADPRRGPELITMAVLRNLGRNPKRLVSFAKKLKTTTSPLLTNSEKRMNLTLSPASTSTLSQLKKATSLNQSEVIRRALIASESDPAFSKELKMMLDADRI
jgi:hypothetical protein